MSLVFTILALSFILFNKTLAEIVFQDTQLPAYNMASNVFGFLKSAWLERAQIIANQFGLIFAAIILLLLAYVNLFGPISL